MNSYKELIVWQKAFDLTKEVYRLTSLFPASELYGLTSQLRRAAVSIVSNIAEGFSRKSQRETVQFFSIAFGSTSEVETQLLLGKEMEFAAVHEFVRAEDLSLQVRKMLNSMLSSSKKNTISKS